MADPLRHSRACGLVMLSSIALLTATTAMVAPRAVLAQTAPPAPAAPPVPAATRAVAAQSAPAPAAPLASQAVVVGRVVLQGNERIDPDTILSYLPISAGDTVDSPKIDAGLKALFRTGLFADIKIEVRGSDLVVAVVENPIINQVLFEGNSNLKDDKLKDEIQIRPRGVFTRAKVEEDVGRIVELYRRSGRISATVTPKIVELPQRRVDLIFEIH